jgi:hypothetical protein
MRVGLLIVGILATAMALGCGDSRPVYAIAAGGTAGAAGSANGGAAGSSGSTVAQGHAGHGGSAAGGARNADPADRTAASGNGGLPPDH